MALIVPVDAILTFTGRNTVTTTPVVVYPGGVLPNWYCMESPCAFDPTIFTEPEVVANASKSRC